MLTRADIDSWAKQVWRDANESRSRHLGPPLVVHPETLCKIELHNKMPRRQRPIDYDAWLDDAVTRGAKPIWRPLKCVRCGVRLSRNCAKRWDVPYCGPHFPDRQ